MQHEGAMADAVLGIRPDFSMPPKKAARFPRTARLLRHADFERVYKQGRRHFSACMTVFYWPRPEVSTEARNGGPPPTGLRIGFTVSRVLGGAVLRNRMKRRLREAVRLSLSAARLSEAGVAADVVINPKKSLLAVDFSEVVNEVSRAFAVIEQKLSQRMSRESGTDTIAGSRKPEAGSRS
jgi:ribonuclease P protein component